MKELFISEINGLIENGTITNEDVIAYFEKSIKGKKKELTEKQVSVLNALKDMASNGKTSVKSKDVAEFMELPGRSVSGVLTSLAKVGMLAKEKDESGVLVYTLVEKGDE